MLGVFKQKENTGNGKTSFIFLGKKSSLLSCGFVNILQVIYNTSHKQGALSAWLVQWEKLPKSAVYLCLNYYPAVIIIEATYF